MATRSTHPDVLAREELFAAAYAQHLQGARAVRDAGYASKNPRRQATALLKRPRVQALLKAKTRASVKAFDIDANRIKEELWHIATVDPAEAFTADGQPLPLHQMPAHVRAAVKSVRVEVLPSGAMRCALDFWSKVDALHIAAKHLALLAPKEVTVTVRFPHAHLSDQELKQKLLESANTIEGETG